MSFISGASDKYKGLLEGRIEAEGSVVACLWKDPLLLDEHDFTRDHFISKDGRFYFNLVQSLRKKGLIVLDEVSVYSNMSEKVREAFDERGGYEVIESMVNGIDLNNFDAFADRLYRENILCSLSDWGFNLKKDISFNKKIIKPIEACRKMTAEEVVELYEALLSELNTGTSSKVLDETEIDFDDEWMRSLEEGEEDGIPFDVSFLNIDGEPIECYSRLSNSISGLLPRTTTMVGGFSSVGKSTWWIGVIMALISKGNKVLVISNEETSSKFKVKFLVWTLAKYCKYFKLSKKKMMTGDISDEAKEQIKLARAFWSENIKGNIKFIQVEDANMGLIKKKIRENVLKFGYDTVIYDTFKIQETDMKEARQDLALVRDSRILDQMAKKYNLIMLCSIQLAEYMKGRLWLDSSCLSNSKQVKEQLENLFLLRNVFSEELDPSSKYYIRPFRLKKDNTGRWHEEKVTLDPTKVWKVLFIEKARSGANSSDTNTAHLFYFDGDHSIFYEYCFCRPRHGEIR